VTVLSDPVTHCYCYWCCYCEVVGDVVVDYIELDVLVLIVEIVVVVVSVVEPC